MASKKITKKTLLAMANSLELKGVQNIKKVDLIHRIQVAEGNSPCFLEIDNCGVDPCLYRAECQG